MLLVAQHEGDVSAEPWPLIIKGMICHWMSSCTRLEPKTECEASLPSPRAHIVSSKSVAPSCVVSVPVFPCLSSSLGFGWAGPQIVLPPEDGVLR